MTRTRFVAALAIGLVSALSQAATAQCPQGRAVAGAIQDVEGPITRMSIQRNGAFILPVEGQWICEGDIIDLETSRSLIKVRMNDAFLNSTLVGPGVTTIPVKQRPPSAVDNGWAIALSTWLPDLTRKTAHAAARSANEDAFWNVPGVRDGTALLRATNRSLLLGWTAPAATYRLELVEARTGAVETLETTGSSLVLPARAWRPGDYYLALHRIGGAPEPILRGGFKIVDAAPPPSPTVPDWAGAELAAATHAFSLIESDAARYGFEALQIIEQAPHEGFDRSVVHDVLRGSEDK
jgi:hypothetical protein